MKIMLFGPQDIENLRFSDLSSPSIENLRFSEPFGAIHKEVVE